MLGQQDMMPRVIVDGAGTADETVDVGDGQAGVTESSLYRLEMELPRCTTSVAADTCLTDADHRDFVVHPILH